MLRMWIDLVSPIMFFVVPDSGNVSFSEMAETEMATDTNETQEESSEPQEEVSQETPPEEKGAEDDLDKDEEFQKEAKEIEKEMGKNLSFNQLKRFRSIYKRLKDAERNLQSKKGIDELDEDELAEALKQRGIELQQATPPPADVTVKESKTEQGEFDEKKYQDLYLNASPEQRQWLDLIRNVAKMENSSIKQELAQYRNRFGELTMSQVESKLSKLEEEARKMTSDKYKLDWEKDILPDVKKLAQSLVRQLPKGVSLADVGWNALTLTKQVIADKGYEVAKVQAQKDTQKEKQKLKQANLEMGGQELTSESNPNMDASEMLREEMQKAGMTSFI